MLLATPTNLDAGVIGNVAVLLAAFAMLIGVFMERGGAQTATVRRIEWGSWAAGAALGILYLCVAATPLLTTNASVLQPGADPVGLASTTSAVGGLIGVIARKCVPNYPAVPYEDVILVWSYGGVVIGTIAWFGVA